MDLNWFHIITIIIVSIFVGTVSVTFGTAFALGARPTFRSYKLLRKMPGPSGHWFIGNILLTLQIRHDNVLRILTGWFQIYTVRFKVWALGLPFVFFRDPNDFQVLLSSTENLKKGVDYLPIRPWLQEGLLVSDGEKWHTRRKMLTPSFHFKILEDNMTIFNECSQDFVKTLMSKRNQEIVIESLVSKCTLKVIMKAAMGIDLEDLQLEEDKYIKTIKAISTMYMERHFKPHLMNDTFFNMLPMGRKFKKDVQFLQDFSMGIINERKKKFLSNNDGSVSSSGKVRKAFLDLMLEYEMKNPGTLTDKGIREEVDTFMFEGHDTTSSAVHFILYSLALYQDVQDKVFAELNDIFGDSDRDVTTHDLQKMHYLEKVIKESLRLYPSVPGISRFLEKDLKINDELVIPAKTNTICGIYSLHRNEKYWPDPDAFDPERFSDENIQGRHPYCYVPFSAGPRNCIGQKFAMMELKTLITNIVRKLKILSVTKLDDILLIEHLVLRSLTPITFKFVERKK